MSQFKQYLGDSVYADFDGFAVTLTTENGDGPSNTIVLEPQIVKALNRYLPWAREKAGQIVWPDVPQPKLTVAEHNRFPNGRYSE